MLVYQLSVSSPIVACCDRLLDDRRIFLTDGTTIALAFSAWSIKLVAAAMMFCFQ